jgi:hypothetical protein
MAWVEAGDWSLPAQAGRALRQVLMLITGFIDAARFCPHSLSRLRERAGVRGVQTSQGRINNGKPAPVFNQCFDENYAGCGLSQFYKLPGLLLFLMKQTAEARPLKFLVLVVEVAALYRSTLRYAFRHPHAL